MRILLANKYYYFRGGDCVYTLGLEKLLQEKGHEVAVFAMDYPDNLPTPWSKYFPSEVSFSPKYPSKFIKAFLRPLFSWEVYRKFSKLLEEFRPDVVHLNNIHTQLSPLIAKIAHDRGIKVVWTLHDYKLLCPRYDCLCDGKSCELCFSGDKGHVVKNKCVKGSLIASVVAWMESKRWNRKKLERYVSSFICPSQFMKEKMMIGGFDETKLFVSYNFINKEKLKGDLAVKKNHYCFVGRLSREKGIETLLRVAAKQPQKLVVIGDGPLGADLRDEYKNFPQIEFLGHCTWEEVKAWVETSQFLVVPSEWYEVFGLTILEAVSLNTVVVGARNGAIPELLKLFPHCEIFQAGSEKDLLEKIENLLTDGVPQVNYSSVIEEFLGESYYKRLIPVYTS